MKSWIIRDVKLLGVVVVLVAALLIVRFLRFPGMSKANPHKPSVTVVTTSQTIIQENALHGTTSWSISKGEGASIEIQAYASATSVLPGQTLTFYVSTQQQGTLYRVDIYRLGWYGGTGGRLMTSRIGQIGQAQGYYDAQTQRLVNCRSCFVNTKTGLVEANWHPSYTFRVPSRWITGVYLAKFTDANGMQTYASFIVRGNFHSVYVAVSPDTSSEAYNEWGGYSLYTYNSLNTNGLGRAVKVSFDRPYTAIHGSGYVLIFETDAIHWLERQGYDISYISNVDLHTNPEQLLHHRVYLSLGHDEYWTKEMRDGVEQARDRGVSLAFLGANASYWQMRFEPDSAGQADRTIVCYKVETVFHDLARDPLYGKDNSRVTTKWRDPVLARPENALVGIMYSSFGPNFPWQVNPHADSPLLHGTGLQPGKTYGCGLVGSEWDRVIPNGATPEGLQIIGTSHTVDNFNLADISDTSYYIAPSGAMVFATGSLYWTASLDSYRFYTDSKCAGSQPVVPGMQKLMMHVMEALATHNLFTTPWLKLDTDSTGIG